MKKLEHVKIIIGYYYYLYLYILRRLFLCIINVLKVAYNNGTSS